MKKILWRIYYDVLPVVGFVLLFFIAEAVFFHYPKQFTKQMTLINHRLELLIKELSCFDQDIDNFEQKLKHYNENKPIKISVTITAYNPTKDQCDSTPFITASNTKVREGIVALSRDIEKEFNVKFGDKVEIKGLGVFEFQDRMHKKWKRKVDIFMWHKNKAIKFGKKEGMLNIL